MNLQLIILQGEQVCIYHYVAEQQYFAGEGQQNNTVMSEVEIMCNSGRYHIGHACNAKRTGSFLMTILHCCFLDLLIVVGLYNGNDAALYCMTLQNTSISGSMLENADEREARYISTSNDTILQCSMLYIYIN